MMNMKIDKLHKEQELLKVELNIKYTIRRLYSRTTLEVILEKE
jgi:hypothetical protein